MGFSFKYQRSEDKPTITVYPVATTIGGFVTSTCVGYLCVSASTVASNGIYGGLAANTTGDQHKIVGIIHSVPTDTTPGSTVPFYVMPILPGDFVEGSYSTNYERSTGASVIASTNRMRYIGIGINSTVTSPIGFHLDPSLASTAPGTTDCLFFKMLGYSTQNDTIWGTIHSTHLCW